MSSYRLFSAGGNPTALIYERVEPQDRSALAAYLMASFPEIEQVGFLMEATDPDAAFKLEMMGDELCVNAARCAAFTWLSMRKIQNCSFELSGCETLVSAFTSGDTVHLEFPASLIRTHHATEDGMVIDMQGIRYLLTDTQLESEDIPAMLLKHAGASVPAIGLIHIAEAGVRTTITPYIHVKKTGTFVEESACGSGSIAASYHSWLSSGALTHQIQQPSGSLITVRFQTEDAALQKIFISGEVIDLGHRSYPTHLPQHSVASR